MLFDPKQPRFTRIPAFLHSSSVQIIGWARNQANGGGWCVYQEVVFEGYVTLELARDCVPNTRGLCGRHSLSSSVAFEP